VRCVGCEEAIEGHGRWSVSRSRRTRASNNSDSDSDCDRDCRGAQMALHSATPLVTGWDGLTDKFLLQPFQ